MTSPECIDLLSGNKLLKQIDMANTIGFIADLAGWLKEDEFGDWGTIHLEDNAEDGFGTYVITLNYEKDEATLHKIVFCAGGKYHEVDTIDGPLDHTLLIRTFRALMREARQIRQIREDQARKDADDAELYEEVKQNWNNR